MLLRRGRLIPAIVASPRFLQNLDSSVMVTALPSIASSLAVPTLHLNLAITAYLLSLAVFLPVSGWLADRLGARRVCFAWQLRCFRWAPPCVAWRAACPSWWRAASCRAWVVP